jgi:hypothetical protein
MNTRFISIEQDRARFLADHALTAEQFSGTGLKWDDLQSIADDHRHRENELLDVADMVGTRTA